MMQDWVELARDSVLDPRGAAARLQKVDLPDGVPMMMLALLAVLNGMLYSLLLHGIVPLAPVLMAVLSGGIIWVSAWLLQVVGAQFGGVGTLPRLLRVVLWLQAIRLVAQAALLLVSTAVPVLGPFLGMIAGVWGIYMTICFVAEAHRFATRWKAVWVLGVVFVVTLVVTSLGASLLSGSMPAGVDA